MLFNLYLENLEIFKKIYQRQMEKASEELDFEKASIFRDRIKSLKYYSIITKN